jgi:hypothetical protein
LATTYNRYEWIKVHLRQALAISLNGHAGCPTVPCRLNLDKKTPPAREVFLTYEGLLLFAVFHPSGVIQQALGGSLQKGFELVL